MSEEFFEPEHWMNWARQTIWKTFGSNRTGLHPTQPEFQNRDKCFPSVSLRDDVERPACSPDLSICDRFDRFLWGYLKGKVFKHHPLHTLKELKIRIREEIMATLLKSSSKMHRYWRPQHKSDIIFKTQCKKLDCLQESNNMNFISLSWIVFFSKALQNRCVSFAPLCIFIQYRMLHEAVLTKIHHKIRGVRCVYYIIRRWDFLKHNVFTICQ